MTSIIIPIYNVAPYLRQCLNSLLAQTITDWEAILVDDTSTDESVCIAEEYAQKDPRFTIIRNNHNRGQSAARNKGLEVATGEYIAFLDADDWWDADYLERHLAVIDGYDMVQSGYRRVQDGKCMYQKRPLHCWQFTSACMRLYRRELIDGLRFEEGIIYEDVLWTVDVLLRYPHTHIINYLGYNYSITPNSTTSTPLKNNQKRVLNLLKNKKKSIITYYTYLKLSLYFLIK